MMVASPLQSDVLQTAVDALKTHGSQAAAARALGLNRSTYRARLQRAQMEGYEPDRVRNLEIILPQFPASNLDAEEILDHMERASEQRIEQHQAMHWFEVQVKTEKPIGICWFGDPHLGSNGNNIRQLRADVATVVETESLYGANIGDTADNWGGRLIRCYAENDVSRETERLLAEWFLLKAGIDWLLWLEGNHDHMDEAFVAHLRAINGNRIPMIDWRARFKLVFSNKRQVRIDAAHDHKGHSMWNELHGQLRAAHMDEHADLFVAGHKHNWAQAQIELTTGRVSTLLRTRGYKGVDSYTTRKGFANKRYGAAVVTVINPQAESPTELIKPFPDVQAGAEYLTWLRARP